MVANANKISAGFGDILVPESLWTKSSSVDEIGKTRVIEDEQGNKYLYVRNTSGVTIGSGAPVKFKSDSGAVVEVDDLDTTDSGLKPYGYTIYSVANGEYCLIQTGGVHEAAAVAAGIAASDKLTLDGTNQKLKAAQDDPALTTPIDVFAAISLTAESGGFAKILIL